MVFLPVFSADPGAQFTKQSPLITTREEEEEEEEPGFQLAEYVEHVLRRLARTIGVSPTGSLSLSLSLSHSLLYGRTKK